MMIKAVANLKKNTTKISLRSTQIVDTVYFCINNTKKK